MNEQSHDRRPLFLRKLNWVSGLARALADAGVSPNVISVIGLLISLGCGGAFYMTGTGIGSERAWWATGALLMLARVLANTLDGMVAVEYGRQSRVGLLYNEAPDRIGDVAILIGCGYGAGSSVMLGYLAACITLFVSYVRTLAQLGGAPGDFSGPMAKLQRVIITLLTAGYMTFAPTPWYWQLAPEDDVGVMAVALLLIVIGGAITATKRLWNAGRYLREAD